jgi:HD-GYP domain-containing protein (c-di-GMP phosphodiesterase class II)
MQPNALKSDAGGAGGRHEFADIESAILRETILEHGCRVGRHAFGIAWRLGLAAARAHAIAQAACVHDLGKLLIPEVIRNSAHPLDAAQRSIEQTHSARGSELALAVCDDTQFDRSVLSWVTQFHHERWDGQGYPFGFHGEQIPLEARIVAVADRYEDLTAAVPLETVCDHGQALQFLRGEAGRQLDPAVVEAFCRSVVTTLPSLKRSGGSRPWERSAMTLYAKAEAHVRRWKMSGTATAQDSALPQPVPLSLQ